MPRISTYDSDPAIDARQSETALDIKRGVLTGLRESNTVYIPEFTLPSGRRADLIGLDPKGMITIVEIKSSIADFNADNKWHEYKNYCDTYYFATHPSVPAGIFPEEEGLIIADKHGCEIIRESNCEKIPTATRKSLTLKIARSTGLRYQRMVDFYGTET